jgi:hypothetical protein
MSYKNKVKVESVVSDGAIGVRGLSLGVNSDNTYGGSPYTGWYNTFTLEYSGPSKIVMYKSIDPAPGAINPDGYWRWDPSGAVIPMNIGGGPFTFECWVLFKTSVIDMDIVKYINTSSQGVSFGVKSNGRLIFTFNNNTIVQSPAGQITANNWFHVAVTRDTTKNVNLYINGNNVGSVFENGDFSALGTVGFFENTNVGNFFFTNLRVVTQTAIYPTESVVSNYPTYPLNKSYDDTAMLILGKRGFQFQQDYSDNNATFSTFQGSPYFDPETDSPINLIVDGTIWDVDPWTIANAEDAMINLINGHPSRFSQPYFTTASAAVQWAFETATTPILFSNIDYFETDGGIPYLKDSVMLLDSGYISSYPLVRERHYNLRKFGTYAEVNLTYASYNEVLGGRIDIDQNGGSGTYGIRYNGASTLDLGSFSYYGILGFSVPFNVSFDLVGCYYGNQDWRVERTGPDLCTLYVNDNINTERNLGTFNLGPAANAQYFSLTVTFDSGSGGYSVLLNDVNVLNGNVLWSRIGGTSNGVFVVNNRTRDKMAHYVSSLWTYGDITQTVVAMNAAFNTGRYPGIV